MKWVSENVEREREKARKEELDSEGEVEGGMYTDL